ncbi:hypothetical protein CYMTET_20655 [Cymbomonas tetramitiformis]|uniref:Uncharacterized protein n=1 Tax=Cymbomonas tetramitiformis TaxID=36881 RepID=A0AAE0G3L2_9CHLO|nr:hypothetical protein CYMTET_20655 [Cymbomonas tetramitiformis]
MPLIGHLAYKMHKDTVVKFEGEVVHIMNESVKAARENLYKDICKRHYDCGESKGVGQGGMGTRLEAEGNGGRATAVAPAAKSRKAEKASVASFLDDSDDDEFAEPSSGDVPAGANPEAPITLDDFSKYLSLPIASSEVNPLDWPTRALRFTIQSIIPAKRKDNARPKSKSANRELTEKAILKRLEALTTQGGKPSRGTVPPRAVRSRQMRCTELMSDIGRTQLLDGELKAELVVLLVNRLASSSDNETTLLNGVHVGAAVKVCVNAGQLGQAERVLQVAREMGGAAKPNARAYTILMNHHCGCGDVSKARQLLAKMDEEVMLRLAPSTAHSSFVRVSQWDKILESEGSGRGWWIGMGAVSQGVKGWVDRNGSVSQESEGLRGSEWAPCPRE